MRHRGWSAAVLTGAAGALLGVSLAFAAAGDVLFTLEVDPPDGGDVGTGVAAAIKGKRSFVAYSVHPSGANRFPVLHAFDTRDGNELWSVDPGPAAEHETVSGVAAAGSRVVIGISRSAETGATPGIVRAFHGRSGKAVWDDTIVGPEGRDAFVAAVASKGGRVYVAGGYSDSDGVLAFVRCYAAGSGKLKWEHREPVRDSYSFGDLGAFGKYVAVVGYVRDSDTFLDQWITVIDKKGRPVWRDEKDFGQSGSDNLASVHARGRLLVAAGHASEADEFTALSVRAFDIRSGDEQWDHVGAVVGQANDVVVDKRTVIVAGREDTKHVVLTLDAETGAPGWEDARNDADSGSARLVCMVQRVAVVAGYTLDDGTWTRYTTAHDPANGNVLWQESFVQPSNNAFTDACVVAGPRIVVAGTSWNDDDERTLLVQAFSAK